MAKRPNEISIRFLTKARVDRIKRVAKSKGWSMNQYVITALDEATAKELTATKAGQLMTEQNQPALNQ